MWMPRAKLIGCGKCCQSAVPLLTVNRCSAIQGSRKSLQITSISSPLLWLQKSKYCTILDSRQLCTSQLAFPSVSRAGEESTYCNWNLRGEKKGDKHNLLKKQTPGQINLVVKQRDALFPTNTGFKSPVHPALREEEVLGSRSPQRPEFLQGFWGSLHWRRSSATLSQGNPELLASCSSSTVWCKGGLGYKESFGKATARIALI